MSSTAAGPENATAEERDPREQASQAQGRGGVAPAVFYPAAVLIAGFALFAILTPDRAESTLSAVQSAIVASAGWYYVLLVAAFVVFSIWIGVSRYGDITLGRDDEEPEFGLRSWFAMLFSAGMGIGLVFWGVAEPLNHYASPRPGFEGSDTETAQQAMTQTFLHWGFHAWAIYVVVGLALAYAIHRKGRPVSIRWALEPLLGDRVRGRLGDVIDVAAVVGTLFGVATSLGLGVLQLGSGLETLGVTDSTTPVHVLLIGIITAIAVVSVASGLGKGIKWLSNVNIGLAAGLMLFVLVAGPTLFLLRGFVTDIGAYLQNVMRLSFDVSALQGSEGSDWQAAWTTFYWGWWISWSPFVGVFIARISRGRTVREFVAGVLLVPTLVTFVWFSILGGAALYRQLEGQGGLIGSDGSVNTENALFGLLQGLPGSTILIVLSLLLITSFFVTSSDSGSLVVDMLTSGGDPEPPTWSRVFWAVLEGVLAAALLLAGGLTALQTASITVALPFSLVMIGMCVALVKALSADHKAQVQAARRRRTTALVADALEDRDGNGTSPADARHADDPPYPAEHSGPDDRAVQHARDTDASAQLVDLHGGQRNGPRR